MKLIPKILLASLLFTSIVQAATITINSLDTAQTAQAKLNASSAGDTVQFVNAVITGTLADRNGLTWSGKVKGITSTAQAFVTLPANANACNFIGLDANVNCGFISAPSGWANSTVNGCTLNWANNGTYFHRIAIQVFGLTNGVKIEGNTFLGNHLSDRTFDIHDSTNLSIQHNTYTNCGYGGHEDGILNNVTISFNTGTGFSQMADEIQDHGADVTHGNNVTCEGNVYTDWYNGTNNSFGISIPLQQTNNITLKNNYISLGNPALVSGTHFGYGIEYSSMPGTGGVVSGNTVIGNWVAGMVTSQPNTPFSNNKIYGTQQWGPWTTEGGIHGTASWTDQGGNQGNLTNPPVPPVGPTPPNPVTLTISNVTDSGFDYAITSASSVMSGTMTIKTTANEQIGQSFAITALKGTIVNCPTNWGQQAFVSAGTLSASASFHTTGAVGTGYPQPGLSMQPAVKGVTPPPTTDPVTGVESIVHHQSGKTETTGVVPVK